MAAKKKANALKKPIVSAEQKKRIQKALSDVETKLLNNYKSISKGSGKTVVKETKKLKKNIGKARKRIEVEVRKNPAGAAVAAAVLGAVAGAIIMSRLKKR
ncbi:MAG: hypothetical protein V1875_05135 [Candidatus Altiarchaeota archaeon]